MKIVLALPGQQGGRRIEAAAGTALRDVLFGEGVEFPCGGQSGCGGCRVRVVQGSIAANADDREHLTETDIRAGWRLACRHHVESDVTLELAQWDMTILTDSDAFTFTPRDGLGIAIDLGTTTIAAQLVDLSTGHVLQTRTALNAQAMHGADVLSRAHFALNGGADELTRLIRRQLGALVIELAQGAPIKRIVIAGNSAMHHFFGGLEIAPLATYPFHPAQPAALQMPASSLGWPQLSAVYVMPCIGGLVGGDILAGVKATGLANAPGLTALIDLGTNGEVVLAQNGKLICTSTAAGPAFEGAGISCGMQATRGAIDAVTLEEGKLQCRVIGGGPARGICGSGLVDAVAAGLASGFIAPNGRLQHDFALSDGVRLTPADIREVQLAKAAIAAGLRLLTAEFGATLGDIDMLYLAGAFGNAIRHQSACRIGLLPDLPGRITPAGNTALKGAKQALFDDGNDCEHMARRIENLSLGNDQRFQDVFAEEMRF